MSRRLGIDLDLDRSSFDFKSDVRWKLEFLDAIRLGQVFTALGCLDIEYDGPDLNVTPYREDPELFKYEMRDIADMLERELKD